LLRGTQGSGFSEASGGIDRQLNQAGELTLSQALPTPFLRPGLVFSLNPESQGG
jgi:hypothetical protein